MVEEIAADTTVQKPGIRSAKPVKPLTLSQVKTTKSTKSRFSTGIGEMDRVLGGGIVPGAVMLIGGEPGIGKSTLLTQMMLTLVGLSDATQTSGKHTVLYICGEESPSQIFLRIKRMLDIENKNSSKKKGLSSVADFEDRVLFVTETDVDSIAATIHQEKPSLVIVDSIQTITTQDLSGASGSLGQLRESTDRLITVAKTEHVPIFLVGHVTKEGVIAGPKILEHSVDAVIELSGERTGELRILRALKNRFGATDEVGIFQIVEAGLIEVTNPSALFLENQEKPVSGSATVCVMEGTRPLLAEVQALVVHSQLAMPRRVGRGVQLPRIQVLAAVLEKHGRLPLSTYDVFLNAAGGFKINEPAVDLGLAVAIASSLKNRPLPTKALFIGEVGLLGEIRNVSYMDKRVGESKRLGFTQIYSRQTHKNLPDLLRDLSLL